MNCILSIKNACKSCIYILEWRKVLLYLEECSATIILFQRLLVIMISYMKNVFCFDLGGWLMRSVKVCQRWVILSLSSCMSISYTPFALVMYIFFYATKNSHPEFFSFYMVVNKLSSFFCQLFNCWLTAVNFIVKKLWDFLIMNLSP